MAVIPPEGFDAASRPDIIDELNERTLEIFRALEAAVAACEPIAPPFKNVAALFFHEYLRFTTTYYLRIAEKIHGAARSDLMDKRLNRYPFIDWRDVEGRIDVAEKDLGSTVNPGTAQPLSKRLAWKAIELGARARGGRGRVVGLAWQQNAFGNGELVRMLLSRGFAIKRPTPVGVQVANAPDQMARIRAVVEPAMERVCGRGDLQSLFHLIEAYLSRYLSGRDASTDFDVLVGGTGVLRNRIMAAAARAAGKPVVSTCHGENDGVLDEPPIGVGDYGYATHVLSYGRRAAEALDGSLCLHPPYAPPGGPEFAPSNGASIMALYDPNAPVGRLENLEGRKAVYITTLMVGFNTYGPFRAPPDVLFASWWGRVLRIFPRAAIKIHPSNDPAALPAIAPERIIGAPSLETAMAEADALILDSFSTALSQAAATDKPVIFLDLGYQNYTPAGLSALKERCIYVNVRKKTDAEILADVAGQARDAKTHAFTREFSLDGTGRPRIQALGDLLDRLLPP